MSVTYRTVAGCVSEDTLHIALHAATVTVLSLLVVALKRMSNGPKD